MKDEEYHVANFATFVSKIFISPYSPTPPPPHQKWMNLISNQLSTASIKYLNWPSPVFGRFQNGCNKEVIGPRVMQFWSEITPLISAQIALHSVQLPLYVIRCYLLSLSSLPSLIKKMFDELKSEIKNLRLAQVWPFFWSAPMKTKTRKLWTCYKREWQSIWFRHDFLNLSINFFNDFVR